MGCDIHLYTEYKDETGKWLPCEPEFRSDYYDEDSEYFSQGQYKYTNQPYSGRNYTLFSYLADVRNGRGFAGCDTGDRIEPIDNPRGLPDDVSGTVNDEAYKWQWDGHSHSWFTLKELKEARDEAKKRIIIQRGWVNSEEYKSFKENGKPDGWCGMVSGQSIEHVSNEEMEQRLGEENIYTQIEWESNLYEYTSNFWEHVIPQLDSYYETDDDEDIRIVFWFDN